MSQSYDRGTVEDFGRWRSFTAGMWAWLFHKFTGWVLVGYLFTHIAVLSTALQNPGMYNDTIVGLESLAIVRLLEVGLLAVAVFHILNGSGCCSSTSERAWRHRRRASTRRW
jgi:succinate dehydrogenase / fumarate reductase cytochrome b subunit